MPKFYKYRYFDNKSAPKNEQYTNNIILNSSLYFSPIKDFNDPFDCRLSYRQEYSKKEIRQYFIEFLERHPGKFRLKDLMKKYGKNNDFISYKNNSTNELISRIGVLSLSTKHNSILMWSHYSNNHTGLVFEFNTLKNTSCFALQCEVDYSKTYELLSYAKERSERLKLALTKHEDWKYESEYRILDAEYQGEKKFDKSELTKIIFGAFANEEDIKRTISLCKSNGFEHVKFEKASLVYGEFALSFSNI